MKQQKCDKWHLCANVLSWLVYLVLKLQTSEPSEKFRVKLLPINLFGLKMLLYIFILFRDGSQFWSKFKTRKSQGLPLSCNSSQLSIWAHKCHYIWLLVRRIFRLILHHLQLEQAQLLHLHLGLWQYWLWSFKFGDTI